MTFKFKIGESVMFLFNKEVYTIDQRRIEWGLPYYRLSSGKIVPETSLI